MRYLIIVALLLSFIPIIFASTVYHPSDCDKVLKNLTNQKTSLTTNLANIEKLYNSLLDSNTILKDYLTNTKKIKKFEFLFDNTATNLCFPTGLKKINFGTKQKLKLNFLNNDGKLLFEFSQENANFMLNGKKLNNFKYLEWDFIHTKLYWNENNYINIKKTDLIYLIDFQLENNLKFIFELF